MILDRTTLLAKSAENRKLTLDVDVPEIGMVRVKKLSAAQVAEYLRQNKAHDGDEIYMMAWITIKAACSEDCAPLFTEEDLNAVREMPFPVLNKIATEVAKFTGIAKAEAEKKAESAS